MVIERMFDVNEPSQCTVAMEIVYAAFVFS